jgi:hypothetical protein
MVDGIVGDRAVTEEYHIRKGDQHQHRVGLPESNDHLFRLAPALVQHAPVVFVGHNEDHHKEPLYRQAGIAASTYQYSARNSAA